jgi:UrcA family protein
MTKAIPALTALAAASAMIVPTMTQAAEVAFARVPYADLNLASHQGQRVLTHRIAFAADSLCGVGTWKELALKDAARDCSDDAIASARPAYDAAVNAARHGSVTVLDGAALIITAQ